MGEWTTRAAAALAIGALLIVPGDGLRAQEDPDDERCVCVGAPDADELRERIEREVRVHLGDRPRLGISYEVDDGDGRGVRIDEVLDDSPAEEAGLQGGDVIVSFDGHRLSDPLPDTDVEEDLDDDRPLPPQRLVRLIQDREPGDEVEVTYRRDGEERTATVELDDLASGWTMRGSGAPGVRRFRRGPHAARFRGFHAPDAPEPPMPPRARRMLRMEPGDFDVRVGPAPRAFRFRMDEWCRGSGFAGSNCVAGLDVRELNEGLSEYFGTDRGVVVLERADDAPFDLEPGDVILAVDGREVDDVDDLRRILRSYEEDEEVRLRVRRGGRELDVEGRMQ